MFLEEMMSTQLSTLCYAREMDSEQNEAWMRRLQSMSSNEVYRRADERLLLWELALSMIEFAEHGTRVVVDVEGADLHVGVDSRHGWADHLDAFFRRLEAVEFPLVIRPVAPREGDRRWTCDTNQGMLYQETRPVVVCLTIISVGWLCGQFNWREQRRRVYQGERPSERPNVIAGKGCLKGFGKDGW